MEKTRELTKKLEEFHSEYSDPKIQEIYANGLASLCFAYGTTTNLQKTENILEKLTDIYETFPNERTREELAKGLAFSALTYGKVEKNGKAKRKNYTA